MHRAFAAWLIERPWRPAVVAAVSGALSPQMLLPFAIAAGAIPALVALTSDARSAFIAAAASVLAASFVVLSVTAPSFWVFATIGLVLLGPVALALLLRESGSLNLCFQLTVLAAGLMLAIVHLALHDPIAIWTKLLREVLHSMAQAGIRLEGDQDEIVAQWARTMWGALAALLLAVVFGGLLLARWWLSLVRAPGRFGAEYRSLRLGAVLGLVVSGVFALALVTDSSLAASLAWVSFTALAFQGLAAAHRLKAGGKLNRGWLAAIYVGLIVPLSTSITVFILAIWGFADNWSRPRTQRAA